MKTTRVLFALFSAMAAVIASAQVQFVFVEKLVRFTQNSSSAPSVDAGTPYQFKFEVNGTGMSGFTPVQIFTTASGSGVSGPINASYTSSGGDELWHTTLSSYTSQALMDADFKNGVYALKVNSVTPFNITLGAGTGPYTDNYPAAAPMLTGLSAGNFDGSGNLIINLALTSYTFSLNGLPGYTSGGHVGIFINGVNDPAFVSGGNPSGNVGAESIYFTTAGLTQTEITSLTFNPSASSMVAGNTYILELEYNLAPNAGFNAMGLALNELDLGLFTYRTQISLIAVPEPSTYAAIFGAVALAGVILHRRRRVAV